MIPIYQNKEFLFVWKPHGIPSTFGLHESFLELLEKRIKIKDKRDIYSPIDLSIYKSVFPYFDKLLLGQQGDLDKAFQHQTKIFSKKEEYGLLNRLDNDTAGFLYFTKTLDFYNNYKNIQSQNKIIKYYFARVEGNPFFPPFEKERVPERRRILEKQLTISYEIMHHKTKADRMIAIVKPQDIRKGRSKPHPVQTEVKLLYYDKQTDTSNILVQIHKGIRHQIRVHLASIGHPIIGDTLYGPSDQTTNLQLFSFGCQICLPL